MSMTNDIRTLKTELRKQYREARDAITHSVRENADMMIARHLWSMREYRDCDTILTYVSTGSEVDTLRIIDAALIDGKRVAVPRCIEGKREMVFHYISGRESLKCGAYGILEPPHDAQEVCDTATSLCIAPALSFDENGYRLGYGGGYYDRFLSEYDGVTVGLCYDSCVQGHIPRDQFDRSVSILITERNVRNTHVKGEE